MKWVEFKKQRGEGKRTAEYTINYVLRENEQPEIILNRRITGQYPKELIEQFQQTYELWDTRQKDSDEVVHTVIRCSDKEDPRYVDKQLFIQAGEVVANIIEKIEPGIQLMVVFHVGKENVDLPVEQHNTLKYHAHVMYSTSSIYTNRSLQYHPYQFTKNRIELERAVKELRPELALSFTHARELRSPGPELKQTDGDYYAEKRAG